MQLNARLAFDTQILVSDKKNEKVLFDLEINEKKQTNKQTKKTKKNPPYLNLIEYLIRFHTMIKLDIFLLLI